MSAHMDGAANGASGDFQIDTSRYTVTYVDAAAGAQWIAGAQNDSNFIIPITAGDFGYIPEYLVVERTGEILDVQDDNGASIIYAYRHALGSPTAAIVDGDVLIACPFGQDALYVDPTTDLIALTGLSTGLPFPVDVVIGTPIGDRNVMVVDAGSIADDDSGIRIMDYPAGTALTKILKANGGAEGSYLEALGRWSWRSMGSPAALDGTYKPSQGAALATEALRAIGTTAGTAAAGNDSRFGQLSGVTPPTMTTPADTGKAYIWNAGAWLRAAVARLDAAGTFAQAMGISAAGTLAAPALWFVDAALGFRRSAANTLQLVVNGAASMTWAPASILASVLFRLNNGFALNGRRVSGGEGAYLTLTADVTTITQTTFNFNVSELALAPAVPFTAITSSGEKVVVRVASLTTGSCTVNRGQFGTSGLRTTYAVDDVVQAVYEEHFMLSALGPAAYTFANQPTAAVFVLPPRNSQGSISRPSDGQLFIAADGGAAAGPDTPLIFKDYTGSGGNLGLEWGRIDKAGGSIIFKYNADDLSYSVVAVNSLVKAFDLDDNTGGELEGWTKGTGSPEGVVPGVPGDCYIDKNGGAGTTLYVKETGVGTDTGWVAK